MAGSLEQSSALPAPWIQTPPPGWLGFLGIKSGGRQPGHVEPDLSTVMEMAKFYQAGARTLLANNAALAAVFNAGSAALYTVPQGKATFLESVNISTNALGAVANVTFDLFVSAPGGQPIFTLPGPAIRALTGEAIFHGWVVDRIIPPGSTVGIFTSAAAAFTAFNYFANVWGSEVSA